MEKNNNLEKVINETLQEAKTKWSKIIPSLQGKQAKRHLTLLTLLITHGPQTTWDLAKLYLEKIEKIGVKDNKTFFYYRAKENSIIYKRLKFLESKGYVRKEGSVYHPTVKAWFLLLFANPQCVSILPFNHFIEEMSLESEDEQFLNSLIKINEPQTSKLMEMVKTVFDNPVAAKGISETFRAFVWSLKINLDEIEGKQLVTLLISCIRRWRDKIKNTEPFTFFLPDRP